MRTPTVATLVLSVLTVPAFAQQAQTNSGSPSSSTFAVGDPERRFDSESANGAWLAVHLLPTAGSPESRATIQDFVEKAPTVAGVKHVFVSTEPAESFRMALATVPGGDKQALFRDADGQLATRFSIKSPLAAPVLIVLDPARHELFRHNGTTPTDHLSFTAFAERMAHATQDKEAREANVASRLAIEGYDPVAYLDEQKAIPGDKKFESSFKGITYRFASSASRDTFNANPMKYLPAYGGWCATAMAKGDKVEIDPGNFKVTNGRLFLFYKGLFGNALNDWKKDEPGLTVKADANWKNVTSEK